MLAETPARLDTVATHSIRVGSLAYKGYRLHNAGHCKTPGAVLVYQALHKFNIMLSQKKKLNQHNINQKKMQSMKA